MIRHYFKIAFRQLLKYKSQNLIAILGLSVGVFCFSLCFYISRFMESVDQSFKQHEHLIEFTLTNSDGHTISGTPYTMLKKLRQRTWNNIDAFTAVSYLRERPYNVQIDERKTLPYKLETMEVDSLYEKLFTPTVIAGSWQNAVHNPNAVILTESMARKIFPHSSDAIGKSMTLTNRLSTSPATTPQTGGISYTIQAVIKDLPFNASMHFMKRVDMLTMNDSEGGFQLEEADFTGTNTYALLKERATIKDFEKEIRQSQFTIPLFGGENQIQLFPIGGRKDITEVTRIFGLITGIVGLLVLLAGLLNFYHFQLGCFLNRTREFSLRKVLGNNIRGLFGMQFIQMCIVIVLSTLLSGCLVELFAPALHLSMFNFSILINKNELLVHIVQYLVCLLILSALICLGTALYIRRSTIQTGLHGSKKRTGKRRLRNFLLGTQFFICWLFVSLTLALYLQAEKTSSSLYETLSKNEKKEIIGFAMDYTFMKNGEKLAIIDRIRHHSGIKEILPVDVVFTKGVSGTGMYAEKDKKESYIDVAVTVVPKGFASFMHLKLTAGRDIQTGNEMLVDRNFAEKQKKDLLGKTYYDWNGKGYTVVGIIDTFSTYIYNDGFGQEFNSNVYYSSNQQDYVGYCYLKCYPGQEKEVKKWVYAELHKALPSSVEPEIMNMQEEIEASQELENKLQGIVLLFAIVCLIITLLGVYSAITLDAERRQKEVAVRKVNGAGTKHIFFLFGRLYILLLSISFLLAFPIIFLILHAWKEMYKVFFNDGVCYWISIFCIVTLLTAITVVFRIYRTANMNPAEVIKNE